MYWEEESSHLGYCWTKKGDCMQNRLEDNIAYPFTKTLLAKSFEGHLVGLGIQKL